MPPKNTKRQDKVKKKTESQLAKAKIPPSAKTASEAPEVSAASLIGKKKVHERSEHADQIKMLNILVSLESHLIKV